MGHWKLLIAIATTQIRFGSMRHCWPAHAGPLRSATRLQRRMYAITNVCAVQMSLYTITADYNEPLEAAHCYSDDDRYDLAALDTAGQPTLDLSHQL